MPSDGDHTPYDRDDLSDDESLFGSPPPSPITGKTSLALPSGRLDSEQNVGTLALPGSHDPSKLPVDSVVSLLDARHRPFQARSSRSSTPAYTAASRAASLAPTVMDYDAVTRPSLSQNSGTSNKRKRTKKSSNTTSAMAPGPSIELPPSDAPVPPNFLRNQQALLGIAGLVAKINPASLSTRRYNQGNDPQNPIVVEEGGTTFTRFGRPVAPTPAQLLATLSAQKDLFPVLDQLLGILRRGIDPPAQSTSSPSQPSSKRRKLSQVPAGAADWDVPFPFSPGEGPPNYKEEWTNERCERLVSDFIALLREGANKAAARAPTKRAASQPAPQLSTQSHPTSARRSLPPANVNCCSPSSKYVPLPLDAYLRPTAPYGYAAPTPTSTTTQSLESGLDTLTLMFGAVELPQSSHLPDSDPSGTSMDLLPPGIDLDPLLLSLMGTGPSQEGPNGAESPAPSSDEAPTPALSYSPYPSQSITSGPMTPNFDPSFAIYSPSPSGSVVSQQDRTGSVRHPKPQDGMELGMDDDFSRVFGIEADVSRVSSVANQPPHFCDPPSVELQTFPGLELLSQGSMMADQAVLLVDTPAPSTPLPSSTLTSGTSDIPSFFSSYQDSIPSFSNTDPPTFTTASLQRQRPVPKRPTLPTPPSKSKAAATLAVTKKRREDAIQQARELRRQLLVDIGKSKVQLWELTMEQGVLTRISRDERLTKSRVHLS
ncbi:hypothetical protein BJ322DRAFT_20613 [Thelephora terrestris]|uniref:Uncharacterized protein n=1 Tax=Thelephora terrestris TaxID=56493 RepID=A0A9P6HP48_9AGAM|nr:hypothetical protein BJ322DRAFT_20613 [Thelephora terrestris]